jgi:HTH-type transcriptional regulator, sugar sensing transcriptional regulator
MTNYINILINAGLSQKEASVYLANYELGESTASRIAQKSGIKRPTAYMELENLIRKGLVSQSKKKNLKYYTASNPKTILSILNENKNEFEKNIAGLLSIGTAIDKKPSVRYFEGEEGMKEVYRDTLSIPNQEIQSWFSGSTAVGKESIQEKYYIPERQKKNIWIRAILPDSEELRPYIAKNSEQLRKSKTIDETKYNMDNEIILYAKNKTAILNYGDKLGIIINSSKIHESIKQIFEIMWEILPNKK